MRQRWGRAAVPLPEAPGPPGQPRLPAPGQGQAESPSVYDFRGWAHKGSSLHQSKILGQEMTPGWGWGWGGALQGRPIGSHNRPAVASRLVAPLPSPKTLRGGRKEQGHPWLTGRHSKGWWSPASWPLGLPTPCSAAGPRPPGGHRKLFRAHSKPKRKGWPGVCSEPPGLVRHGK